MTFWRRLIRFLARADLSEAEARLKALHAEYCEAVVKIAVEHALALELAKRQAHAEGQMSGRQEMHEHICQIVGVRTGGCGDFVNPEDLARAKKGLLH